MFRSNNLLGAAAALSTNNLSHTHTASCLHWVYLMMTITAHQSETRSWMRAFLDLKQMWRFLHESWSTTWRSSSSSCCNFSTSASSSSVTSTADDRSIYSTHTHTHTHTHQSEECMIVCVQADVVENDSRYSLQHLPLPPHLYEDLYLDGWGSQRGGRPTSRRRWSRLVLLRVPMMRRPIFLAYHTELSMLLVAAAAAVWRWRWRWCVASSAPPLSPAAGCGVGGGGAGWRADDGRGASLHLVSPLPLPPPLPHRHKQQGCRGADGGDQLPRRAEVVLLLSVTSSGGRR